MVAPELHWRLYRLHKTSLEYKGRKILYNEISGSRLGIYGTQYLSAAELEFLFLILLLLSLSLSLSPSISY